MEKRGLKQIAYMCIVKRVVDMPPLFTVANQTLVAKETKLMRHRRLFKREFYAEIMNAAFFIENRGDESHAGRV